MRKSIAILVLLLIIVLSFGFVFFRLQAQGSEGNYFNTNLRAKFAEAALLRQLLSLHNTGDARADYLGDKYPQIYIEVDAMDRFPIDLEALDKLEAAIENVTGKEVTYAISDHTIRYESPLTRTRLDQIVAEHERKVYPPGSAVLYLFIASSDAEQATLLGLTHKEYGIILYYEALTEFTADSPDTLTNYQESTALHEFGHHLGLEHNDEPECLMQAVVHTAHVAFERPQDVIIDFCDYEKGLIGR